MIYTQFGCPVEITRIKTSCYLTTLFPMPVTLLEVRFVATGLTGKQYKHKLKADLGIDEINEAIAAVAIDRRDI